MVLTLTVECNILFIFTFFTNSNGNEETAKDLMSSKNTRFKSYR